MTKIIKIPLHTVLTLSDIQRSVFDWARAAFAQNGKLDEVTPGVRVLRFFEEAVELLQAEGIDEELAIRQLREVYSRPVGEHYQEVGGVMITLMAYCESRNFQIGDLINLEILRINNKPVSHFQKRQQEKMGKGLRP